MLDKIGLEKPNDKKDIDEFDGNLAYNYFYDQGYKVDYVLGNLGSTLVYLFIFFWVYLLTGLFYFLGKKF